MSQKTHSTNINTHREIQMIIDRRQRGWKSFATLTNLEAPRPRSEIGRSSFKHRAALAWNLHPHNVKECANLRSFKIALKANKHLLNNINFARGSCCVSMKNDDFLYF